MKIVQVNTICGVGSIGRICVDLYETLQKNGEEAKTEDRKSVV